jgi:RNA polymerase sigma-70 factor (ECF subfamily)
MLHTARVIKRMDLWKHEVGTFVGNPVPDLRQNANAPPSGAAPLVDVEAFLRLIEREALVLLKVTSALVGFADAEDAAQETVVKAWQARASLRDPQALRAWLLQIAVNICREWRRGRFGRWQRVLRPIGDDVVLLPAHEDAQPGANAHAAALDLRAAINALDVSLRLIVVLRYYGGLDATEIGAVLSLPAPTVRTRLRRALTLLRQQLSDSGRLPTVAGREGDNHVE